MKNKVLGLVIVALGFSTFGAFAQSTEKNNECTQTEVCTKECHKDKKDKKDKKLRKERFSPFAGIELTPEQQQSLDKLRADRKAQKEADKKAKKEAAKKDREQFNADVEKILTPEQFKQYQANCDSMKNFRGAHAKKAHKMKKGDFSSSKVKKAKKLVD